MERKEISVPEHRDVEASTLETEKKVIDAEDIALARSEFLAEILDHNSYPEVWIDILDAVLEKHPCALRYRQFLFDAVRLSMQYHITVDSICADVKFKEVLGEDRDETYRILKLREADALTSMKIFRVLFNRKPLGDVKIMQGKVSFVCEIGAADYREFRGGTVKDVSGFFVVTESIAYGSIPVSIILRQEFGEDAIADYKEMILTHEDQHLHNRISSKVVNAIARAISADDILPNIYIKRTSQRFRDESALDATVRDEFIAQATDFILLERLYKSVEIPAEMKEEVRALNEKDHRYFWDKIVKALTTGEVYYKQYQ